jgi:hypothetical protein
VEIDMAKFRLFSPGWWLVHVVAIAFMAWLGHAVKF